jgi:hypothetical protein
MDTNMDTTRGHSDAFWRTRHRLFFATLTAALRRDQRLRVSWLCVLLAQTRNGRLVVPVAADDLPLVERLDALLPDDNRLDAFLTRASLHAPELFAQVPRPLLNLWLIEAVLRYQRGKYPDPLQPWRSPGPRKGAKDKQAFIEQVIHAVQAFRKKGLTPTQTRIALYLMDVLDDLEDMLGERSGGTAKRKRRSIVRRIQRISHDRDLTWEEFIA